MSPNVFTRLLCIAACAIVLHVPGCSGLPSDEGESPKVMPLKAVEHLDGLNLLALQAAGGGGIFKQVNDELHLIMHKADNETAVMPDPRKPELGIQMVPHREMASVFPAFAVMLANLTGEPIAANATAANPASFQVVTLMLHDLVDVTCDGQLTYRVSVIDSDLGRGTSEAQALAAAETESGLVIQNLATEPTDSKELTEFLAGPPRAIPEGQFAQASLLIDLVKPDDAVHQTMGLKHMAETGDISYNIHKYLSNPEQAVRAQGVMTIGWMLPWSLWAWICCPTFFILTPWAVPLWAFCCI